MNTTSSSRKQPSRMRQQMQERFGNSLSIDNLRQRIEDHVRQDPLKAIGQAVAAGYILRFLPIRAIIGTGLRLAAPLMLLNRLIGQPQSGGSSESGESRQENRETAEAR